MKTILFLFLCGMTFCLPFKNKPVSSETATIAATPPITETKVEVQAQIADSVSFATQIQPILQTRCNPCHFPGGKMYDKMPFDKAKTIVDHPEGVLKRFKDEKESELLKQFITEAGK